MKTAFRIFRVLLASIALLSFTSALFSLVNIIPEFPEDLWSVPWLAWGFISLVFLVATEIISRMGVERAAEVFLLGISDFLSSAIGFGRLSTKSPSMRDFEKYLATVQNHSKTAPLSIETEQRITEIFEEALGSGLNDELQIALDNLATQKVSETLEIRSLSHLGSITDNLQIASKTVTARGFLNLAIGIAFAAAALAVLQSSVALFTPETIANQTTVQILYLVGIRLSLAIIITVIAYFFLSLYKNSLEDVKYYQNEMTSIGMIESAICMSYDIKSETVRQIIAAQISSRAAKIQSENSVANVGSTEFNLLGKLLDKIPSIKAGDAS